MTASVKALQGPLQAQTDSGIHAPILSAINGTSKALEASVVELVKMGLTESQARRMVGMQKENTK